MKYEDLLEILASFVNSIPTSIAIVNPDGILSLTNSSLETLLGYEEGELVGQSIELLVPASFRPSHPKLRQTFNALPQKRIMSERSDLYALHKNGTETPVEISLSPLVADEGTVVIVSLHDLTARKKRENEKEKLQNQVQQSQKLESLGVLAGGIAHDFNNLLTSILGHTGLAMKGVIEDSALHASLLEIERASERAAELIMQMLAYSGRGHFLIKPINLSRVVEEMASLLHSAISKKAVIRFDFFEGLPNTMGDITQIRQVIMNLITNASDAIEERSGLITLRTGMLNVDHNYLLSTQIYTDLSEGDYVYLEVSDTGLGMSSETKDKIFDPFFTTKSTGRGLGLAAVQGIVRGHSGAIKIYSELNKGSTFKVLLPCSDISNTPIETAKDDPESWTSDGTILVVDDEDSIRAFAHRVLLGHGLKVLQAVDGREALKIFAENADKIDLVLLDLTMPHLGGIETFRELRRMDSNVQVIMMSGYSDEEVTSQFAGKGIAGFLQKPFRLSKLSAMVRSVLLQ
jgi:PAS domain S-box-containing protein